MMLYHISKRMTYKNAVTGQTDIINILLVVYTLEYVSTLH